LSEIIHASDYFSDHTKGNICLNLRGLYLRPIKLAEAYLPFVRQYFIVLLENIDIYNHTHFVYNMSMIVKRELSQIERIRKILDGQHGTLLTSDLAKFNIPRTYLSALERDGEIERVSRGVYRMTDSIEDELFSFQARYKSSIYSHETALYLCDLTDRTPLTYSISVPVGYHSISLKKGGYKIFYVNRNLFDLGVVFTETPHGNEIKTTNPERTICDVLRSRNQIDDQLINEAFKRYVRKKERNIDLLYRYAGLFRVQKIVREYVEVLL
jgi:predicted transcriptional regulator of viral defense system